MPFRLFAMTMLASAILSIETSPAAKPDQPMATGIRINDSTPLIHHGEDEFNVPGYREEKFLLAIMKTVVNPSPDKGQNACTLFRNIRPDKRDHGQYAAFAWVGDILQQPPENREILLRDEYNRAYFRYFTTQSGAVVRDYINRMYHLGPVDEISPRDTQRRIIMLTEFLMTLHPTRLNAMIRRRIIETLAIKPGMHIVDVNASACHLTFPMAHHVGPTGFIYAQVRDLATQPYHAAYLQAAIDLIKPANVSVVAGRLDDIGMTNMIDMAVLNFIYPGVYIGLGESERDRFFASISSILKKEGYLAVIDLDRSTSAQPPYQTSYVDPMLVEAQIIQYGYHLLRREKLPGGIYVLLFERVTRGPDITTGIPDIHISEPDELIINTRKSLIHFTLFEADSRTATHTNAAHLLKKAIDTGDRTLARSAYDAFKSISNSEFIGSDSSALQWFSGYFASSDAARAAMLNDKYVRSYLSHFTADKSKLIYSILKYMYLDTSALLSPEERESEDVSSTLDAMLFNNPLREEWEHSSQIVDSLELRPGDAIADIGSGPGYFSFKFADRVGSNGVVYAIELGDTHLEYIRSVCGQYAINNIRTVQSKPTDICVSNSIDVAFLCSLYHAIYIFSRTQDIEAFMASISRVLKPNGRLVIADNAIVNDDVRPYHGPRIAKELLILHLRQFGYVLESTHQFTPQRYVLIFRKK